MGMRVGTRGMTRGKASDRAFPDAAGGLLRLGRRAMGVVAKGDVGKDAFHAVLVFADQVGGEPHARFLFDGIHGNRVGGWGSDQIVLIVLRRGRRWHRGDAKGRSVQARALLGSEVNAWRHPHGRVLQAIDTGFDRAYVSWRAYMARRIRSGLAAGQFGDGSLCPIDSGVRPMSAAAEY